MALVAEIGAGKTLPESDSGTHLVVQKAMQLQEADKVPESIELLEKHLRKYPDDAHALTALSNGLKKVGRVALSYYVAKHSVSLRPERPETWCAVGHSAQNLWRFDEAVSAYRKAIQRAKTDKQRALYLNNMGSLYLDHGQFKKAEQPLQEALKIDPSDPMALHNYGLSLLARRQWADGWKHYSASVGSKARMRIKYRKDPEEPEWDGTPGQKVVVYGEQGLGDEICAASMIPDAAAVASVVMDCDHRLAGLFRRSFPNAKVYGTRWKKEVVWDAEDREPDASLPAFELGKFFRNADADFPGTPYLVADPERVLMWRALWASKGKPTIGIAWTGGTWHNAAAYRQLPLTEWQPIFDAVDATWVSLQYKDAAAELKGAPVVQYPHATLTADYDDTAALVASCDLVIGMQTSVCHLAGALGVPVWTLIPSTSQWRYGESGDTVPWYQSMRLYRQTKDGWGPAVQRIAEALRAHF